MSSVLLYHPLGLGDHIACSGIVREYAKRYTQVGLFCFAVNRVSVEFLYRDLSNVHVEVIRSHRDAARLIWRNRLRLAPRHYDLLQPVGTISVEDGVQYERQFYQMAGVPFNALWESFYVERDSAREQALFDKLDPGAPYIFVHDDARFPADMTHIPTGMPVVRPAKDLTDNIFDYCAIIERAAELHVIDSSFMFLADCLPYHHAAQKLVIHRYTRPNVPWNLPILKKPWTILN